MLGTPVHFFSRTQSVLALSPAGAELYATGSTLAELLHVRNLLEDLHRFRVSMTLYTDSTSAKSLSARFWNFTKNKARSASIPTHAAACSTRHVQNKESTWCSKPRRHTYEIRKFINFVNAHVSIMNHFEAHVCGSIFRSCISSRLWPPRTALLSGQFACQEQNFLAAKDDLPVV